MKITRHLAFALFALCSATLSAAEIRVFAAASLTDALKEMAATYEKKSGDKLVFNFGGSNALARQIIAGAPADIFLSADEAQMDNLSKAGLIKEPSRKELLSNTLVIVVPKDGPSTLTPAKLAEATVKRVALADPRSVPAGVYSREYLTKLGLWAAIEPKVVPTENVRAALAAVETGNVEAGMVYKTDAAVSKAVKVAYEVPRSEGPKISYPVALIAGSAGDNAAAAKLLNYLESKEGLALFIKYGFLPTEK